MRTSILTIALLLAAAAPAVAQDPPTLPLPTPFCPLTTVIHGTSLAAVHVQPAAALTVTLTSVRPEATERDAGSIVLLHCGPY